MLNLNLKQMKKVFFLILFAFLLLNFNANAKVDADFLKSETQTVIVKDRVENIAFQLVDLNSPSLETVVELPLDKPMCHYYVEVEIYQGGELIGVHVYEGEDYCADMPTLMAAIINRYI